MEVVSDGLEVTQPGLESFGSTERRYQQQQFLNSNKPRGEAYEIAPAIPTETICGLRNVTFWLSLVIAILVVIVVGVAVGLGVGLSQGNRNNNYQVDSQAASATTISIPTTTYIPTTTSRSSTTSSAAAASTTTVSSPCPGGNNTIHYEGTRKFRILCDSDFGGSGKKDLASTVMSTFYDCLGLCNSMNTFQDRSDVGCTYNREGTGGQTAGTCWCLGGNKTVISNEGNDIAVPL
ncbi:hypothetical protein N7462_004061 [Penicillium macrosclerotiorum]|uniref:uncharacterized protein n=1 Tax=Penicillium macrosclerotiorum TaxID=303699 RepID=UPI002546C849|nr:uncharacterized protein N7462_004061 [Penicillium macrosclerotiorum]KAJ5689669.1 hypothetical protein N7462_004061 [Penicillium macrosclerotiorum]